METAAFRELLAADVAVELGVLSAAAAGERLASYWETRKDSFLAGLPDDDRAKVEAEVQRILDEAGGDVQAAMRDRGVHREIPASLAPAASHALSEAGARLRAPLRAMDKSRYVGFMPIGQGGMGVVYLALDSELNRRVAFKMIRSGATDPLADKSGPVADDMVARFMQEAVVTGGLEHPGIVPVYELGITPSGVPYYTMRLVRGERTLDDAIKEAATIEDRIKLLESFLKVCDAVGYAHSRGVIHRDLKPANIALGKFGEVVVLDWGLAKMHDRPDLAGSRWQTRLTELREVTDLKTLTSALGTPGYMAPEAALGEVGRIDKRSDVYSLGSILYRILTGRFPFEFSTFPEYVGKLSQGVTAIPDPQGLGRICVKALAPKRADRYDGVEKLAQAIRAWQSESAIDREVETLATEAEAALDAARMLDGDAQLRQLDRSIAVAVRILDLRAGHEGAVAVRERARELRARAMRQREARTRRRLMKRVGVVGLLAATAATIVVALMLNARRREAEEARARAEDLAGFMLNDLHDELVPVGRTDLLAGVARKSLAYYTSLPSKDVTDKERRARALILGRIGEVLRDTGDMDAALQSCLESQRLYEEIGDEYELSVALNRAGDVQQEAADLDGALASYRRSAGIRRALGREADLTRSIDRIATVLMRKGERGPATELYDESLAIRRRLHRAAPDDAERQKDLALSLQKQGELAIANLPKARAFFEEALAIDRSLLAAAPRDARRKADVAAVLFRVAHCQAAMGETEAANKSYEEVLALYKSLAAADPANIWHQRDLALTYQRLGRYVDALEVQRALVARHPDNQRARHDLVTALTNLGDRAKTGGDHAGARLRYEEALAITRKLVAEDPSNAEWQVDLVDALSRMGQLHEAAKRAGEARAMFVESLDVAQRLAAKDPENGAWQRSHAFALERLGRFEESVRIRRALAKRDPSNAQWQREFAFALGKLGDLEKKAEYFEEAVPVHRGLPQDAHRKRELSYCLYRIGLLREQSREWGAAVEALREAESIHRATKGYEHEHRFWAEAYFRVSYEAARAAARQGDAARALELLAGNLTWSRKHLAKDRLAAHLEHVCTGDPDLKPLRGNAAFDALLR